MVGFLFTLIIIIINSYSTRKETNKNISLTLSCPKNNNNNILMDINNIMSKSCSKIELKRFDESNKEIEFIFFIELEGFESLNELKINLLSYNENINISLMNNKELY